MPIHSSKALAGSKSMVCVAADMVVVDFVPGRAKGNNLEPNEHERRTIEQRQQWKRQPQLQQQLADRLPSIHPLLACLPFSLSLSLYLPPPLCALGYRRRTFLSASRTLLLLLYG